MLIAVLATWLGATSIPLVERRVVVAPAETLAVMVSAAPRPAGGHVVLLPGVLGSAFSMRHITHALEAGQGTSATIALHLAAQSGRRAPIPCAAASPHRRPMQPRTASR
jgi:hypothetical protein